MALNSFTEVDYLNQARGLITEQFMDKVVVDKYLQLLLVELTTLQSVFKDLMQMRSLDTAVGVQLDNIGYIVGQPREVFEATLLYYFGFDGASGAKEFGDSTDPSVGGLWRHSSEPESGARSLSDAEYRRIIRAKIIKNSSNCSINSFSLAASVLFDVPITSISVDESTIGQVDLSIGRTWNDSTYSPYPGLDEVILGDRYLPIPVGIKVNYV